MNETNRKKWKKMINGNTYALPEEINYENGRFLDKKGNQYELKNDPWVKYPYLNCFKSIEQPCNSIKIRLVKVCNQYPDSLKEHAQHTGTQIIKSISKEYTKDKQDHVLSIISGKMDDARMPQLKKYLLPKITLILENYNKTNIWDFSILSESK